MSSPSTARVLGTDAQFHQDNGQWKWVVPLPLVQRAGAYLTRQAAQPPR